MKIGIPKEIYQNERRVALTPDTAARLQKLGYECAIESGAGVHASFSDKAYQDAGVEIISDANSLWQQSDIVLKVRAPEDNELGMMRQDSKLISFIWPAQNEELMNKLSNLFELGRQIKTVHSNVHNEPSFGQCLQVFFNLCLW